MRRVYWLQIVTTWALLLSLLAKTKTHSKAAACVAPRRRYLRLLRWLQTVSCSAGHQCPNDVDRWSLEGLNLAVWFLLTSHGLFYGSAHLWTKCVTKSDGRDSAFLLVLIKCDRRLALQPTLPSHASFISPWMSHSDICHVVKEDNLPLYFRDPPPMSHVCWK